MPHWFQHTAKACVSINASPGCVAAFRALVHQGSDAAAQNGDILKFIATYSPQRKRPRKEDSNRVQRVNVQYLARKADGSLIEVCAVAFRGITGFSR